jgi:hypothetical protein
VSKLRENNKEVIGVGVASSTSDLLIANCDEFIYYDDLVRADAAKKPPRRRSRKVADGQAAAGEKAAAGEPPAEPAGEEAEAPKRKTRARGGRRKTGKTEEAAATPETPEGEEPATLAPEEQASLADDDAADAAARATKGLALIMDTFAAMLDDRDGDQKIWGSMVKQTLRRRRPGFNERFYGFRSFNAMLEDAAARGWLSLEKDSRSGGYILHPLEGGYVPVPTEDEDEEGSELTVD